MAEWIFRWISKHSSHARHIVIKHAECSIFLLGVSLTFESEVRLTREAGQSDLKAQHRLNQLIKGLIYDPSHWPDPLPFCPSLNTRLRRLTFI